MTSPLPSGSPPAPVRLAPGVRVVRRGRDRLQVGLHPDRRVVLPRRPGTEALLAGLGASLPERLPERLPGPAPLSDPAAASVVAALAARDLVVPAERRPPARLDVRTAPSGASWPVDVGALLDATTLRLAPGRPDAVLVIGLGEPDRAQLDPLVRDGVPHLVLALVDGGARLGPLVVPGRTACLRCLDAHLAADDPDHLAVLSRYASAPPPGPPEEETDPALTALVTGWALRDLALLLRPATLPEQAPRPCAPASWSATLTWHPRSVAPTVRPWLRHPGCGCGWAAYDDLDGPGDGRGGETRPAGPASGALPSGTMET